MNRRQFLAISAAATAATAGGLQILKTPEPVAEALIDALTLSREKALLTFGDTFFDIRTRDGATYQGLGWDLFDRLVADGHAHWRPGEFVLSFAESVDTIRIKCGVAFRDGVLTLDDDAPPLTFYGRLPDGSSQQAAD